MEKMLLKKILAQCYKDYRLWGGLSFDSQVGMVNRGILPSSIIKAFDSGLKPKDIYEQYMQRIGDSVIE
jgi:hypothetical protein